MLFCEKRFWLYWKAQARFGCCNGQKCYFGSLVDNRQLSDKRRLSAIEPQIYEISSFVR